MSGTGTVGINVSSNPVGPLSLMTITHCTVQGFNIGIGVIFSSFLIADTVVTNNQIGISTDETSGTLDHVVASLNKNAGVSTSRAGITAVDTIANNNGTGFQATIGGAFSLAHSTAIHNGTGVDVLGGGSATSFGDNHIRGNGTDVKGTLTNVGTQ